MIAIATNKQAPLKVVGGKVYARTIAALVAELGITNTTYQDWRMQGCPDREANGYPVGKIFRWYRERQLEKQQYGFGDEDKSLKDRYDLAEVLKLEAEARLKEIQAAKEESRVVDRDEAMAAFAEMCHLIRNRLEQLPHELSTMFPPESRAELISDVGHKVHLMLKEMEGWSDG